MPATISFYDAFKEDLLNSNIDLDSDNIKCALLNNSATFTAADTVFTNVSGNEIAAGNGYVAGGQALANKVVNKSTGTSKWDADDVTWTASGGSITAYKAVLYDVTVSNRLIAFIDLGGVATANSGSPLSIQWNASGILTLTG